METVFISVITLFIFLGIGFVMAKCGMVKEEHSEVLSRLLVWVFLPANIIKTFSVNCSVGYLRANYTTVLVSLAILVLIVVIMHFAAKCLAKDKTERAVYEYSLIIPNFGYMGYALIETVLGETALMNTMMFTIPMSLYTYTVGFCSLSGKKFSPRGLLNPTLISLVIGILFGVSGLFTYMPDGLHGTVMGVLDNASVCMGPVSMILTGIVISGFKLADVLTDKKAYLISVVRLVIIPLAVGGALMLAGLNAIIPYAVLLYAMPCGLNTVVFVKNAGGDPRYGARLALISSVLVCLTAPLVSFIMGI